MIRSLYKTLFLSFFVASCSGGSGSSSTSTGADGSEPTTVAPTTIVQPGSQPDVATPSGVAVKPTTETFEIIAPRAYINSKTFTAEWTTPLNLKDYDIMLSLTTKCNVGTIVAIPDYMDNTKSFGPLTEGEYYLCIQAVLDTGLLWAANSPYKITVDLTPPTDFAITAPTSPDVNPTPTIAWAESDGADNYSMILARDDNCTIIDKVYEGITTPTQVLETLSDGTYYICVSAFDLALNETEASNNPQLLVIDSTPTAITDVSSSTGDGYYKAGDTINIDVLFDQTVTVDAGAGDALLKLETGDTDQFAVYSSGSGTSTLTFVYTVVADDAAIDLEVHTTSPQIVYNDRTLRNAGGDVFNESGNSIESSWLSTNQAIYIDTTAPQTATTLITPPDSAGDPDTLFDDDTGIFFKWTAASDADSGLASYSFHRFDQADCGGASTDITGILTTTFDLPYTATNGMTYSFKITAIDNAGNDTLSACSTNITIDVDVPITAATNLITPADSVGGADAAVDNDLDFFLKWDAAVDNVGGSGIEKYDVHLYALTNCGGSPTNITDQTATSYAHTALSGGIFSYKITAYDYAGNGTLSACSSDIIIDTTPPVAATNLITPADSAGAIDATYDDDVSIYFKWDAATDAESGLDTYTLQRYDLAACAGTSTDTTAISNATLDQNLALAVNGTTYSYKIIAFDLAGNQSTSLCSTDITVDTEDPTVAATSLITPADAVGDADATFDNDATVYFKWSAGTDGETGIETYTLHRYDQGSCAGGSTDTTLIPNSTLDQTFTATDTVTYSFEITAIDYAGNSLKSSCSTDLTIDASVPITTATNLITPADSAGGVDASYDDETEIFFKWDAAVDNVGGSGIENYTVHIYGQSACGGVSADITGETGLDYTYTAPGEGTYSFKITSYDYAGNVDATSACSSDIMVDTTDPTSPTTLITPADSAGGLEAPYDDDVSVYFKWDAGSDAGSGLLSYTLDQYELTACGGASANTITGFNPATLDYNLALGVNGTTYSFTITTIDNAGNTAISACSSDMIIDTGDPVAATNLITPPDLVTNPDSTYDDDTTIFFKWDASTDPETDVDTYTFHRFDQTACGGVSTDTTSIASSTLDQTFASAVDGTTYSFKITTYDLVGNSTLSACSTDISIDTSAPITAATTLITPADASGDADAAYDDDLNIYFKWDAAVDNIGGSGIEEYTVHIYNQTSCGGVATDVTNQTGLDYLYAAPLDGIYSFQITAFDYAGNTGAISGCSSDIMIDTVDPVAATNLITPDDLASAPDATYDNDISIFFKWDAGSDADSGLASYTLERYDLSSCAGVSTDTIGITTATLDDNLAAGVNGTTYSFKVVAIDNAGNTATSACSTNITVDTAPPTATTFLITPADIASGLDADYDDDTGIFFKWTTGSDAETAVNTYTFHRFDLGSCGGASTDTSSISPSTADLSYTGADGTTYSYAVTAIDMAGNTSLSACSTDIIIDTSAPTTASTNLITPADASGDADAAYDDDVNVFFNWDDAVDNGGGTGIEKYTVHIYSQSTCGGVPTNITDQAASDYAYTAGGDGTYSYKITAYDYAGNAGSISACSTDIIVDTTDPVAAANLKTPNDSVGGVDETYDDDTGIFFKWDAASDALSGLASYTLQRFDQTACGGASTDTTSISTATLDQSYTGSNGTTYSYKIIAYDNAGNSATSSCSTDLTIDTVDPVAASSLITPADAAGGADATYDNDTGIFFKWATANDVDTAINTYTLQRYDLTACGGASTDTTSITPATLDQSFTGSDGTTYSYKIMAYDMAGNSTLSACSSDIIIDTSAPITAATNLITPADSAGGADAPYDNDTGIFFKWDAGVDNVGGTGVEKYTVHIYSLTACGGGSSDVTDQTGLDYSYTAGGDGTYSFKITAFDYAGNAGAISACSSDIIVDTTDPTAASNLITPADSAGGIDATYDNDTGIYFKWDAGSDAGSGLASYTLMRYDLTGCGGASTDTTSISTATLDQSYTGSNPNVYSYKIVTIDNVGNSSISACSTDITIDTFAPNTATALITPADSAGGADASFDNDTGIYFKWTAATDGESAIDTYTLHRYDQTACGGASTDTTSIASGTLDQAFTGSSGTTYSFKITAYDMAGNLKLSSCSSDITVDATAPITAATNLITPADSAGGADAAYDDDTGIYFKWDAAADNGGGSGIEKYTVHIYSQTACGGGSSDITDQTGTDYSYTAGGSGVYSFKITAFDYAGNAGSISACSTDIEVDTTDPVAATTLITPADSAGGVDASNDNDTGIFFKWTAGSDADSGLASYTLERYDQTACGGASTDTTSISTATLDQSYTGTNGTTYSFKIVAIDNVGRSTTSACSTDITVDTANPTAATVLITPADSAVGADASYDDDTGIFFKWTAGSDAETAIDTYTLHRYDLGSCAGGSTDTTSISSATLDQSFSGVSGTTYSFKITTFDLVGNSLISACSSDLMIDTVDPITATTLITPADSAGGADASVDNDTAIFFKWTAGSDADSGLDTVTLHRYDLTNCGGSSTDTTSISPATLDATFGSAVNATTYSFKITSIDNAGNSTTSGCSTDILVDTAAPTAFNITGPTNPVYSDTPTVAWDDNGGADTWDLVVDDEASCSGPNIQSYTGLVTNSKALTALVDGTYYACVTAYDTATNSTVATNDSYTFEVETTVLHVSFTTLNTGTYSIKYSSKSAGSWSTDTVATGSDVIDTRSSVSLDTANKAHLSYAQESSGDSIIKYTNKVSGSWAGATTIDSNAGDDYGYTSSLALNDSDKVFIAYSVIDSSANDILKENNNTTGSFVNKSTLVTLSTAGDELVDSSIAIDNAGTNVAHLINTRKLSGSYGLRYHTNATSWAAGVDEVPNNLPGTCDDYLYASITVDSSNNPNISYICVTSGNVCKIYHAVRVASSWTHTEIGTAMASGCTTGSLSENDRPSITMDSADKSYVAYVDMDNGYLKYTTNASGSWVAASVDTAGNIDGQAAITLDDDKNSYILYVNSSGTLKMGTNNSGSWIVESSISSDVTGVGTSATTGEKGRSNH